MQVEDDYEERDHYLPQISKDIGYKKK